MQLKELLELNYNFNKARKDALLSHAIKILESVVGNLKSENFDAIIKMLSYSPAGDCMGCDNYFIAFVDAEEPWDLKQVVETLIELNKHDNISTKF